MKKKKEKVVKVKPTKMKPLKVPRKKREPKEQKPERVKVTTDIETAEYSYEDMVKLGHIPDRPQRFDMSAFKVAYFTKIPDNLRVTTETPEGTKLWAARDIAVGRRKEVYFLKRHRIGPSMPTGMVQATDQDMVIKDFIYEAICVVPQTHRSSQAISMEGVIDRMKEAKAEARKSRKK